MPRPPPPNPDRVAPIMARSRPTDATDAQRRRILDAAEAVLRRHGPGKTGVVDVARELGQSHASVYRYFASKAELIDALAGRWLAAVTDPLGAIAADPARPAADRLRAYLLALFHIKVRKVTLDPELFAVYQAITAAAHAVAADHLAALVAQVAAIIADGVAAGEFPADLDPARAARAVLAGSLRFHHPTLLASMGPTPADADALDVFDLLVAGLRAGALGRPDRA